MNIRELREISVADLRAKEVEIKVELMKLYGQVSTGTPPKNPGKIKQLKRTFARIKTLQNERESQPVKMAPKKESQSKKLDETTKKSAKQEDGSNK